jgi:hypothetical protein
MTRTIALLDVLNTTWEVKLMSLESQSAGLITRAKLLALLASLLPNLQSVSQCFAHQSHSRWALMVLTLVIALTVAWNMENTATHTANLDSRVQLSSMCAM